MNADSEVQVGIEAGFDDLQRKTKDWDIAVAGCFVELAAAELDCGNTDFAAFAGRKIEKVHG
jgi:hypothetical protein